MNFVKLTVFSDGSEMWVNMGLVAYMHRERTERLVPGTGERVRADVTVLVVRDSRDDTLWVTESPEEIALLVSPRWVIDPAELRPGAIEITN
jgi:hypothetical protein